MLCLHTTDPVEDHRIDMAKPVNSTDPCPKLRNKKTPTSPNRFPDCDRSRSAVIDVFLLIAVTVACGYLLFPYTMILITSSVELVQEAVVVLREEVFDAPLIYGCLGLSILYAAIAAVAIMICTGRKCGQPGCRGLRKAAEFDIQLETEECVKNNNSNNNNNSTGLLRIGGGVKRGLFELPRDHYRELEAELKKMAPVNGRAVLVFRARCGCSIGRMEVLGMKKLRKVKK